jgi:hypothetical protein
VLHPREASLFSQRLLCSIVSVDYLSLSVYFTNL